MNRAKIIAFWTLAAINIALAAAVTLRLPAPAGGESYPLPAWALVFVLSAFSAGAAGLHAEIWALVRRKPGVPPLGEDAARGTATTYSAAWTGMLIAMGLLLAYQLYLIGWSRGALPAIDERLFSRMVLTLGGVFLICIGNVLPKAALASARWRNPEAAFRIIRGRGRVFMLFGAFQVIVAWTPMAAFTLLNIFGTLVFFIYLGVTMTRSIESAAEKAAERRAARAEVESAGTQP